MTGTAKPAGAPRLASEGWENLKAHPLAELFPAIDDEGHMALVLSIQANGFDQAFPIILHEGKVLDGRSRLKAAIEAQAVPYVTDWSGETSAEEWVIAANIARRHLSKGQIAMLAVRATPIIERERAAARERQREGTVRSNRSRWTGSRPLDGERKTDEPANVHVGAFFGVSGVFIDRAQRVLREAPEWEAKILAGEMSLRAATDILIERAKERKREEERAAAVEAERLRRQEAHNQEQRRLRAREEAEAKQREEARNRPAPPPAPKPEPRPPAPDPEPPTPPAPKPREEESDTVASSCVSCHRRYNFPSRDGLADALRCSRCAQDWQRAQEATAARIAAEAAAEERRRQEAGEPEPMPPGPTYATVEQVETELSGIRWLAERGHPDDADYYALAIDALETVLLRTRERG